LWDGPVCPSFLLRIGKRLNEGQNSEEPDRGLAGHHPAGLNKVGGHAVQRICTRSGSRPDPGFANRRRTSGPRVRSHPTQRWRPRLLLRPPSPGPRVPEPCRGEPATGAAKGVRGDRRGRATADGMRVRCGRVVHSAFSVSLFLIVLASDRRDRNGVYRLGGDQADIAEG
jgi:hypothetical protein